MAKSKYQNFKEYADNDPVYILKALRDELHRPQAKIEFKDGTTYHVTKAGSRYWEKDGYLHNEYGVASKWHPAHPGNYCLYSVSFPSEEAWLVALNNLTTMRKLTNNRLEEIIGVIAQNIGYERRKEVWQTILTSNSNPEKIIERIEIISNEFSKLAKITDEFIEKFQK